MSLKSFSWKLISLIILGGLVFLWMIKASIMSWYLSDQLKIPISMSKISIWPSQLTIQNFQVKNPRGFKSKRAFEAKISQALYQFSNLYKNPTIIDRIELDDIYLNIEFTSSVGTNNNWTKIAAKIPKKDLEDKGENYLIRKVVLKNLTVEIFGKGMTKSQTQVKKIDRLEFDNISSETGFPTKELINAIFGGAGIQEYIKGIFQDALKPEKALQRALSPLFGKDEGLQQSTDPASMD